uniref:Uncharacterized protein n=1 Tax=Saccharopolyspora spinosa TaxID=60894 RepID=Q6JHR2_SACSN|nr:unknown [Saccharopolyspora spinosa NRRL 18395]
MQIFTYDLTGNDKNQIVKTAGAVELVRAADGPLVGLHVGGDRVGELVGEAQLIYNRRPISCTPTRTEALGEAHLALASKPPHVHG